jgi:hypothetical protein
MSFGDAFVIFSEALMKRVDRVVKVLEDTNNGLQTQAILTRVDRALDLYERMVRIEENTISTINFDDINEKN